VNHIGTLTAVATGFDWPPMSSANLSLSCSSFYTVPLPIPSGYNQWYDISPVRDCQSTIFQRVQRHRQTFVFVVNNEEAL
jgi:hypothetical protein